MRRDLIEDALTAEWLREHFHYDPDSAEEAHQAFIAAKRQLHEGNTR